MHLTNHKDEKKGNILPYYTWWLGTYKRFPLGDFLFPSHWMLDSKELRDRRGDPEIWLLFRKTRGFFWGGKFLKPPQDSYILYMYIWNICKNIYTYIYIYTLVFQIPFRVCFRVREIDPMVKVHGYPSSKGRWLIEGLYKPIIRVTVAICTQKLGWSLIPGMLTTFLDLTITRLCFVVIPFAVWWGFTSNPPHFSVIKTVLCLIATMYDKAGTKSS